jgi:hypothetical protein
MRKLVIAFFVLAALGLAAPPVQAGPVLFQWAINQDGVVSDSLAGDPVPSGWNLAAFDTFTGLGTITASITGAGDHNILVFLDIEIDEAINTFFNEFGSPGGPAPGPGFGWEIDEPGFVFGDIYVNFLAGALDGLNGVPAGLPDDVSFALGRDFILGPDEVATLNFRTSRVAPDGVPYLIHTDPDSDVSVYFSSDLTIRGGGEPVIPEPGTLTLLGLGLAAAARRLRRRG